MKIDIYSSPTCIHCKKTKEYFKKHNVKYTDHNVLEDQNAARKMIEKTGQQGVPVIVVNNDWDNAIIGFDKEEIEKSIKKAS